MKKYCIIIFFSFLSTSFAWTQEFTPVVTQFNKKDYKAHHQNWSISYDDNGVMYFGNGNCLLSYDGTIWSKYNMPYNQTVRSVMAVGNKIYVGSYEEFGYFEKMQDGRLIYHSLSKLLDGYQMQNDEIWKIIQYGDKIIFQAFTSYFIFDGNEIKAHKTVSICHFFCKSMGKIYTYTDRFGLCTIDCETAELTKINCPFDSPLVSIVEKKDGCAYFVTYSNGIFLYDGKEFSKFETDVDKGLETWQVNRADLSQDGNLIVGTLLNGAICINADGNAIWTVNTSNILQSNTVLGIKTDASGNIWVALDSGIALIPADNSMMYISSLDPGIGTIYTAYYNAPYLYMGTGQGLYRALLSENFTKISDIEIIPEIRGNVWDISEFDSQVFISTNTETFELSDNGQVKEVSETDGGMCFANGKIAGKEVLVQGTYTKLCIYVKEKGRWIFSHSVDDFINPINTVVIDYSGTIWAGHMHHGLYAINLSKDLKTIDTCKYYESLNKDEHLPIWTYLVNERVVFADTKSIYTYDDIKKEIIPYKELNSKLGHFKNAYRVCRSGYGSYWFINDYEAAKINLEQEETSYFSDLVVFSLFSSHTADMYQNIIPIAEGTDLFTLENSIALYRSEDKGSRNKSRLFIKELRISNASESSDSLLSPDAARIRIPYKYRNLDFTMSCPRYAPVNGVSLSHILEGADNAWTKEELSPYIKYRYLAPGNYVLRVKALTESGMLLDELSFEFKILKPFYRSLPAYIVYLIILAAIIYSIGLFYSNKATKNNLEKEIKFKSKELASTTLTLIRKNEALIQVRNELEKTKRSYGQEYPTLNIKPVTDMIDSHLSTESDWKLFQHNFDRIHENFFRNLKKRYPELTANDLKFCAFLRLNLSSKEIASLMNISLKGVEAARYRIRKKIGLSSEDSLTSFLIGFNG